MKISYIIPAYNASASIIKCIYAIVRQRGEKEIIIVNDGSTDSTKQVIEKFKFPKEANITIYDRPHLGASATRNYGLSMATGDYIAMVDADTRLDAGWAQKCLNYHKKEYDLLLTNDLKYHKRGGQIDHIIQNVREKPYVSIDNIVGLVGNGTFMRKDIAAKVRYDPDFIVGGEDNEITYRLIKAGLRLKVVLSPSYYHKHEHRRPEIKYLSFIKKKIVFGYGNILTYLKHPDVEYAKRSAMQNWMFAPFVPILYVYKKIQNYFLSK